MTKSEDIDSTWLVVVPTVQLTVSNEPPISGAWKVGDITFMSKEALAAYLHPPTLHRELNPRTWEIVMSDPRIGEHQAFAVATRTGNPKELRKTVFRDFREAVHVLASSNGLVTKRSSMQGFTLQGSPIVSSRKEIFLDQVGGNISGHWNQHGMLQPFVLDANWHKLATESGIVALFDRVVDLSIDPTWRRQIKSGAAMLGKSLMALERADAFLLDVMGLETLLTVRGERNGTKLAQRIKGMVGWHLQIRRPAYVAEIEQLHKVRCEIVHDSDFSNLTTELLLQADMYLFNSLLNIVNVPALFPTKRAMMAAADGFAINENWPTDRSVPFRWVGNPNLSPIDLELPLW
jgi:hypothetical protein